MKQTSSIKALFLDIGGVLLTNGWGHHSRLRAAKHFGLDFDELISDTSPFLTPLNRVK
jgi:putative hydrolase of the HAD superfamily